MFFFSFKTKILALSLFEMLRAARRFVSRTLYIIDKHPPSPHPLPSHSTPPRLPPPTTPVFDVRSRQTKYTHTQTNYDSGMAEELAAAEGTPEAAALAAGTGGRAKRTRVNAIMEVGGESVSGKRGKKTRWLYGPSSPLQLRQSR